MWEKYARLSFAAFYEVKYQKKFLPAGSVMLNTRSISNKCIEYFE